MKTSRNFRLSDEAIELLDAEATRQGSTRTAIVEMLVRTLRRGTKRRKDDGMAQSVQYRPDLRFPYMDFAESIRVKLIGVRIGATSHEDLDINQSAIFHGVYEANRVTFKQEEIVWTFLGSGFFEGRQWEVRTGVIARGFGGELTSLGHILLAVGLYTAEELSADALDTRDPRQAIGAVVLGTLSPTSESGLEYRYETTTLTILPPAVTQEV